MKPDLIIQDRKSQQLRNTTHLSYRNDEMQKGNRIKATPSYTQSQTS